ncbi:MAG: DUF2330 domain-containing protein [Vulcanimicrobiota bacterium]
MKKWFWLLPLFAVVLVAVRPSLGCICIPRDNPQNPQAPDISMPEQRAFLYARDNVEHMILSVQYNGAPSEFAWVIPTETQAKVDVQAGAPFHELWNATRVPVRAPRMATTAAPGAAAPEGVVVLERKEAGPYDIAILQASSGGGLYRWLQKNGFSTQPSVREALDSYVKKDWYFVAARIRPAKQQQAGASLQNGTIAPLHISYKASELTYPLRVTSGNPGTSEMELFVVTDDPVDHASFRRTSFTMTPRGKTGFKVLGEGADNSGDYPTLRKLLPKGGKLSKYSATLSAAQRSRDLSFASL